MPEAAIAVEGLRCRACGTPDPGPRELCAVCHADELEAWSFPGTGTLVSWTVVRRAPTRFKGQTPYAIAVVDLHAGVRVTGRLRGDTDQLTLGAAVGAVAREGSAYVFEETKS